MTNPVRHKQARRAMLEALARAGNYALPEEALLQYVNDLVKPPLNYAEQGVDLAFLRDGGYIRKTEDSLDPEWTEWVITELGRNLLASL